MNAERPPMLVVGVEKLGIDPPDDVLGNADVPDSAADATRGVMTNFSDIPSSVFLSAVDCRTRDDEREVRVVVSPPLLFEDTGEPDLAL